MNNNQNNWRCKENYAFYVKYIMPDRVGIRDPLELVLCHINTIYKHKSMMFFLDRRNIYGIIILTLLSLLHSCIK